MKTIYAGTRTLPPIPLETPLPDGPLVTPSWLEANLQHPGIVVVESNEDPDLYGTGHIPGAHHVEWRRDLNAEGVRDLIGPREFAALAERLGVTPETTIVFYGDRANWWAAFALWVFHLFGHTRTKILDGGRDRWIRHGRPWTRERPSAKATAYPQPGRRRDRELRAYYEDVVSHHQAGRPLLDVRSPHEFAGLVTHLSEHPNEGVRYAGHIPGARSVPWSLAVNESGTFKSTDRLRELYLDPHNFHPDQELIVYCSIGERSSHTWFVMNQILGFNKVRNYDGSWTEWANRIGSPITA